jgi:hypothetical protein
MIALASVFPTFGVAGPPSSRRTVAFNYSAVFTPEESRWYQSFSSLVTGGILDPEQTRPLRAAGTRLIAYEWSSAFYPDDHVSITPAWQRTVARNAKRWLLNSEPLGGGAAEPNRVAYWYDFGNSELIVERASYLAGRLEECGYDGYFFDTLGLASLPASIQHEFQRRHSSMDYERCQGRFLKEIRRRIANRKLIFLNQAYRNADIFLPYADLDLTESYFTYIQPGGFTGFRAWRSETNPWDSITKAFNELVVPAARRFPHVSFVHLNYAAGDRPVIARALRYGWSAAKLWNQDSYLSVPSNHALETDEIYFADLGHPATRGFQEDREASVAWRVFEKGVVAINAGRRDAAIPSLGFKLTDPPNGYIFR